MQLQCDYLMIEFSLFSHKSITIFIGITVKNLKFVVRNNNQIEQIFVNILEGPSRTYDMHIFSKTR